jgi:hypothetical protein
MTANPHELVEELKLAILNHPGPYVPDPRQQEMHSIMERGQGEALPGTRLRSVDFIDKQTIVSRAIANPAYLSAQCVQGVQGDHNGRAYDWPFQGYNMTGILALVWNCARHHEHRDEIVLILIEQLHYGLTGNSGAEHCPNGKAATTIYSMAGVIDLANDAVDDCFSHDRFTHIALHTSYISNAARIAAAEAYLSSVKLGGCGWIH